MMTLRKKNKEHTVASVVTLAIASAMLFLYSRVASVLLGAAGAVALPMLMQSNGRQASRRGARCSRQQADARRRMCERQAELSR